MIPILYEPYETEFTSNGLGRLRECTECIVTEERNGIFECDFSYPVTGAGYDRIQLGRIIAVTHDDSQDIQPFDIVSCSRPIDGVVSFHAVHISYRQTALTAIGKNISNLDDAFDVLKRALPGNPFTYESDKAGDGYVACLDGTPRSVRSVLGGTDGSLLDTYGGEYEWDKWTVRFWEQRGQDRNFTIRYGLNLIDYTEELDFSESYTAIVPYWAGTSADGATVVVQGDMLDSGQRLFGTRTNCVPFDVSDKFQSQPTKAQVNNMGRNHLTTKMPYMPQQSISVDFVRLSDSPEYAQYKALMECRLCDTIKVVFPRYNMSGRFKIVKITYDVLQERYLAMELGTLQTSLAEALGVRDGDAPLTGIEQAVVVKDVGIDGVWRWRKWSNGKVEAWGRITTAAQTGTAWGAVYYSDVNVTIPTGIFEQAPTMAYATGGNTQWWALGVYNLAVGGCTIRAVHPNNSSQAIVCHLYLVYE